MGEELDFNQGDTLIYLINGARGKQRLVAGGGWKRTGGICASNIYVSHLNKISHIVRYLCDN